MTFKIAMPMVLGTIRTKAYALQNIQFIHIIGKVVCITCDAGTALKRHQLKVVCLPRALSED